MSAIQTTTSKRDVLRFSGYRKSLSYKTDYEDGEAQLVNISTGGCAISDATIELTVDEKLLISFALENPEKLVEIQAVVVWADTDVFGLKFQHMEGSLKHRILRFFAQENRRQKNRNSNTL